MISLFFNIIISVIIFEYFFGLILDVLNSNERKKPLHSRLIGVFSAGRYKKSQLYEASKDRLDRVSGFFFFALTLIVLYGGFLGTIDNALRQISNHYILLPLLFFAVIGFFLEIISLPFQYISTFIIEERFGFNKTNLKTFFIDKIKSILLISVIGGMVLSLIIWVHYTTGQWFWFISWLILSGFMLFFAFFYSTLIVPIFNKQTPLPLGDLRTAIEQFAKKADFAITNIFVIDGSKRSNKANAYFAGFGRKKRIVLYDTLMENHDDDEIVAILAHEIGHNKLHHVRNGLVIGVLQSGMMLFLLSLFIAPGSLISDSISKSIAGNQAVASFHLGVIAFGILYSPVSMLLGICVNMISRRNEYAADAFASNNHLNRALQNALIKLSRNNLSNLQPHAMYVFVHYTHPPILRRLLALDALHENSGLEKVTHHHTNNITKITG